MSRKVFITYHDYAYLMDILVNMLKEYKFDYIVAPPRGALPIATHLSHHLDVKNIYLYALDTLMIKSKSHILLVDDIADTGVTLAKYAHQVQLYDAEKRKHKITTATLFYKPHSEFKPDYYVDETNNWIVFPWEVFDERPNREKYKHLE